MDASYNPPEAFAAAPPRLFRLRKPYEMLWFFTLPVTAVVILPSLKGTTPAAIFGLLSYFLPSLFFFGRARRYYMLVGILGGVFLLTLALSQLAALGSHGIPIRLITLVQPSDQSVGLRVSTITQSLYLISAVSTFFWVFCYRSETIDKALAAGMWLLVVVGWVEWAGFLVTGHSMDFLTNRSFGETLENSGSLFQSVQVLGHSFLRFKSLTGEPSMFALTALPAFAYFLSLRRWILATALFVSLLATFSTTAYIGLGLVTVVFLFRSIVRYPGYVVAIIVVVTAVVFAGTKLGPTMEEMIISKIQGTGQSGQERQASFKRTSDFFTRSPPLVQLFGAGFGTAREYSLVCTLLINTGVLGVLLFLFAFLVPIVVLFLRGGEQLGLCLAVLAIFACFAISVPEFSYPTSWTFLGLAWRQVLRVRNDEYEYT